MIVVGVRQQPRGLAPRLQGVVVLQALRRRHPSIFQTERQQNGRLTYKALGDPDGSFEPEWLCELTVSAQAPKDIGEAGSMASSKWIGVSLEFFWHKAVNDGVHPPVDDFFITQALAGRVIEWV